MTIARKLDAFLFIFIHVATLSQQSFAASMDDGNSQLDDWTSDVLAQYQYSPESQDLRRKENLASYLGCNTTFFVNYSDPLTQAVYIRSTLAPHALIVTQIIKENPTLSVLFDDRSVVNIVVIGGGPAPEIAGVLHYLLRHHGYPPAHAHAHPTPPMVRFLLADEVTSWRPAVDLLERAIKKNELEEAADAVRPRFEKIYYQWNFTKTSDEEHQVALHLLPTVITGDLFIFQYVFYMILRFQSNGFVSELSTATQNLQQVFASAPDGALFLFVDVPENREDLKMFLETDVFSSIKFTRLVDNIRQPTPILTWNDPSKACEHNRTTDQAEAMASEKQTTQVVLLYRKTLGSSQY